jgi:hypothetical protein
MHRGDEIRNKQLLEAVTKSGRSFVDIMEFLSVGDDNE